MADTSFCQWNRFSAIAAVLLLLTQLAAASPTSFRKVLARDDGPKLDARAELEASRTLAERDAISKFRATIPGALHQCEQTNLYFFNSANVRPLTVLLIPAAKLPSALKRVDARTTLNTAQGYGPVQTISNIKTLDTKQYDFGLKLKQGQQFEIFAFFPNGTGYNMNLGRTIMYPLPGAASSCFAPPVPPVPTCGNGEYLDTTSNKCKKCTSKFTNSTTCTAAAPLTCSYGVVKGAQCTPVSCSGATYLATNGARCVACPDQFASRCDASGASTRCTYGNVVKGKCTAKICTGATYPNLDGKSCANCHTNVTSCTAIKAITCKFGVPNGANCVARDCAAKPSYLSNDGASCIACRKNATACDSKGATKCSYGVVTAKNGSNICAPVPCISSPVVLSRRLAKRGSSITNYLSQNGTMCLPCPLEFALTCDFRGALSCYYGLLKNGKCVVADCSKTPKPSTVSGNGQTCIPCSANALTCDMSGATTCSYGVVTYNFTLGTNVCAPVPCESEIFDKRKARRSYPTPNYLSQDGKQCIPCSKTYAMTCDYRGATSCYRGMLTNRTCVIPDCSTTPKPTYLANSDSVCLDCPTNATTCNWQGATACSYGNVYPDFNTSMSICRAETCVPSIQRRGPIFQDTYLTENGKQCLPCDQPNFMACDFRGALSCNQGNLVNRTCIVPNCTLTSDPSYLGNSLAGTNTVCINCGTNATSCDQLGATGCSFGSPKLNASTGLLECTPKNCTNPLPSRLTKRQPSPRYLSEDGTTCGVCDQNVAVCDYLGALKCSNGNLVNRTCIVPDCTLTSDPSYLGNSLAGTNTVCINCGTNATSCDQLGATGCSFGSPTFNANTGLLECTPKDCTNQSPGRLAKREPSSKYLSEDGTTCGFCDVNVAVCDYLGALKCSSGNLVNRTCIVPDCNFTPDPSYLGDIGAGPETTCINCGTNATSCNAFGAIDCSFGLPQFDAISNSLTCQPADCSSPAPGGRARRSISKSKRQASPMYLSVDGKTCGVCDEFETVCDYLGALGCSYGLLSNRTCVPQTCIAPLAVRNSLGTACCTDLFATACGVDPTQSTSCQPNYFLFHGECLFDD